MRILIVSQYFWPEQFRINDIALALKENGHDILVLTGLPNYPKGKFFKNYNFLGPYCETYEGIPIFRVPLIPRGEKKGLLLILNYFSFLFFASILGPLSIRGKVDKIFIYQPSPVTVAFPAIILKWLKGSSIIFWVTDLWPETLEATGGVKSPVMLRLWGSFVKFLYSKSDKILVTSKGFIEKIVKRGVPAKKVEYWPQWAEDLFTGEIYQASAGDFDENLMPKGFNVTFAGNIGSSQSFETIVEAAEILKDYRKIHWVILGDGLMKKWVEEEVVKRDLQENFHLLGRKPIETMPFFYSRADLLLASLKKDPLFAITVPAKIQSYLASARPIVASMDGEGASLIEDSMAGVSCPAGCAKSLAEAILTVYRMGPKDREELGKNGRNYFFLHFERNKLLTRLEAMLRDPT